jgi:hypothetical protein
MALDHWPLLMQLRKQDPHRNVVMAAVATLHGVRQVRRFYAEYHDYISRVRQLAGVADWNNSTVVHHNISWTLLERIRDERTSALWQRALPCLTAGGNGGRVEASTEDKS